VRVFVVISAISSLETELPLVLVFVKSWNRFEI